MMNRPLPLVTLAAASLIATACGYQHTTSVLVPTSANTPSTASPTGTSGGPGAGAGTQSTPTLVGTWASASPAATLPNPSTSGNFQYQITSQNGSSISGTFSGVCGGGLAFSGSATGQLNGTAVTLPALGTPSIPDLSTSALSPS